MYKCNVVCECDSNKRRRERGLGFGFGWVALITWSPICPTHQISNTIPMTKTTRWFPPWKHHHSFPIIIFTTSDLLFID